MNAWRLNLAALALCALGTLQIVGGVLDWTPLRGVAAAWGFAPYPKVFSDVRGLETFASSFTLQWQAGGRDVSLPITPELYAKLRGPYNRRNVYGAALAYAPRLPAEQWQAVYCYGLRSGGPLRRELGVPDDAVHFRVRIDTRTRGRSEAWTLAAPCVP